MLYTIASPRPVPLPTSFVVKKGSNIRSLVFSSMPAPVSEAARRAYGPGFPYPWTLLKASSSVTRLSSRLRCPPSCMASRALVARFMSTCSIWPESPRTMVFPAGTVVVSSRSSPISLRKSFSTLRRIALRSSGRRLMACFLLMAQLILELLAIGDITVLPQMPEIGAPEKDRNVIPFENAAVGKKYLFIRDNVAGADDLFDMPCKFQRTYTEGSHH